MMMCISGVSDFEALTALAIELNPDAERQERMVRGADWAYARRLDKRRPSELAQGLAGPILEPPRPYSHGRRFIPAWLAAERERCMWSDRDDSPEKVADHWKHGEAYSADPSLLLREAIRRKPAAHEWEPLTDLTGCDV